MMLIKVRTHIFKIVLSVILKWVIIFKIIFRVNLYDENLSIIMRRKPTNITLKILF